MPQEAVLHFDPPPPLYPRVPRAVIVNTLKRHRLGQGYKLSLFHVDKNFQHFLLFLCSMIVKALYKQLSKLVPQKGLGCICHRNLSQRREIHTQYSSQRKETYNLFHPAFCQSAVGTTPAARFCWIKASGSLCDLAEFDSATFMQLILSDVQSLAQLLDLNFEYYAWTAYQVLNIN